MYSLQMLAQETNLPGGGFGQILFWIVGAAVILGLWFLISRTRKKSYNDYWSRRKADEERQLNDPDMARPNDEPPIDS